MLIIDERTKKATYPKEPLIRYLELNHRCETTEEMAEYCKMSRAWIQATDRGMSDKVADKVAITLGVHPSLIWGDDYWEWYTYTAERAAKRKAYVKKYRKEWGAKQKAKETA